MLQLLENLKLLLIDRLKSRAWTHPDSRLLRALTSLISSEPLHLSGQPELQLLGWNEVAIDYHCLQIAIACLEADPKAQQDLLNKT
jgi:hypothetical protein